MFRDLLEKRFTAKWWNDDPVDPGSLAYILECAYLAPSKQGRYNYKIYVFGDSEKSLDFKNWLYWENTWCLDTVRAKPGDGLKRFNGQVTAPVVLMWVSDDRGHEARDDCLVSASIAMCAALEKNLQTGFNGCLGPEEISKKFDIIGTPVVCLGIGHADTDYLKTRPVYQNNNHIGFDLSNTDPKITDIYNRKNKPKFSDLIVYI